MPPARRAGALSDDHHVSDQKGATMMRTGRITVRGKRPGDCNRRFSLSSNHFSIFRPYPVEYNYLFRKAATATAGAKKSMSGKQSKGSFSRNVVHIVLCIVTVLLIGHTGLLAAEPQPGGVGEKQVVVLYSQPRDFPATEMVEQGLLEELAREKRVIRPALFRISRSFPLSGCPAAHGIGQPSAEPVRRRQHRSGHLC